MQIKEAEIKDINSISQIYALSWKIAYRGKIADAYLDDLQEDAWVLPFKNWLTVGGKKALLCMDGKKAVGAAAYFLSEEEKYRGFGELQSIYVLPSYFYKGCGRLLVEAVEKAFIEKGVESYYLWVLRENLNAKHFYNKMGFKPTEDRLELEIQGQKLIDERWIKNIS